jgi:hypothetical protein
MKKEIKKKPLGPAFYKTKLGGTNPIVVISRYGCVNEQLFHPFFWL